MNGSLGNIEFVKKQKKMFMSVDVYVLVYKIHIYIYSKILQIHVYWSLL